jgi:hypothetical protein
MAGQRTIALTAALLVISTGCAVPIESSPEGEQVEGAAAVVTDNALVANARTPSALAAIKDAGTGGTLSRLFVKYAVGCAFVPSQSFSFSWTDTENVIHNEVYYGILGIAPDWAKGSLSKADQEMVSACLAGRTNYYGTSVTISMRSLQSPLKTLVGSEELTEYPYVEGGFWGNLFTKTPYLSACYNTADVSRSR